MSSERAPASSATLRARFRVRRSPHPQAFSVEVDLTAPPGITILFGPSGSGKSTLLGVLAGLLQPEDGEIHLGSDVWLDTKRGVRVPAEARRVAYVFQSLALFPHMTALENVAFGVPRDVPKPEQRARAQASLERFRVAHVAGRRPRTFSGGEAQRVALARAFAMDPRLVLLDEPFSAMDRELRRELAIDVRRIADALGVPVLQVTHHRNEARAMGDRIVLLEAGRVRASGGVTELLPRDVGDDEEP
jgi:molybdate transport system ATP-binding protein